MKKVIIGMVLASTMFAGIMTNGAYAATNNGDVFLNTIFNTGTTVSDEERQEMRNIISERIRIRNAENAQNTPTVLNTTNASSALNSTNNVINNITTNDNAEAYNAIINNSNYGINFTNTVPVNNSFTQDIYSLQRINRFNNTTVLNGGNNYVNINNKYQTSGGYLFPEINRAIINRNLGYSLYRGTVSNGYYNYFSTYSNNQYNRSFAANQEIITTINALIQDNFNYLESLEDEVQNDIGRITALIGTGYGVSEFDIDLYEDSLTVLTKIQNRIISDRRSLNELISNY